MSLNIKKYLFKVYNKKVRIIGGKQMKSYIAKPQEVERKWYVVDAAGKPLGRVASQVAS